MFERFKQINTLKAKTMIDGQSVVVIDIRKGKDYQEAHIEGALSVDKDRLDEFAGQTDRSSPVLCYCYKGISSKDACRKLVRSGFRSVYSLKGGFDAWRKTFL